ncbi:MAG: hypothetical protein FWG70_12260 [Oscillospiraceae bacterium]|nr:hypothetical protein [Oscillospiraceae bacterium]
MKQMKLDLLIDKLTPCLEEVGTGKILQTTFSVAETAEITGLKKKGWHFDWADEGLRNCNVYKLQIKDDDVIQGLVAAEVVRGAVYIQLGESAPHNQQPSKKYEGVGGHLFAIAVKLSMAMGFGGYVYFEAKNEDLVKHYSEKFGATMVPSRIHVYRMEIFEDEAQELIEKYTLEGDLNVR